MSTLKIANDLERVGDHGVNIAEDAVFLVEGRTIKHHAESDDGRAVDLVRVSPDETGAR